MSCACFGITCTTIGMIQKRLAWPLHRDNTQIYEAFHFLCSAPAFSHRLLISSEETMSQSIMYGVHSKSMTFRPIKKSAMSFSS